MSKSVLNVNCEIKRATLEYKYTKRGEEEKSCSFLFYT